MAEAVDRPALHEIKIPLAIVVPQPGAFAFDENRWRPGGNFHECVRGISVDVHDGVFRGSDWSGPGSGNKKAALRGAARGSTHKASSRSRPSGGAATASDDGRRLAHGLRDATCRCLCQVDKQAAPG